MSTKLSQLQRIIGSRTKKIAVVPVDYGLGQKGFFDIFVVKFDLLKEEIELKERTR